MMNIANRAAPRMSTHMIATDVGPAVRVNRLSFTAEAP